MGVPSTPRPENLVLGAGEVLFDRKDAAGAFTGYRPLGNVESLNVTVTVETLEKKSSMDGARGIYKSVVIGSEAEFVMVLSEMDAENKALLILGDTADFTQTAATGLLAQPINNGVALKFHRWYQMQKSGTPNVDVKKLANVVVKQGAVVQVLNSDYKINLELGLIMLLDDGANALEAVTTWDGDVTAIAAGASKLIRGLSVGKIEGRLKYFSATNQAAGPREEVDIHNLNLTPDGEQSFISEEFMTGTIRGKAQKDTTKPLGEEFFTRRTL